MAIVGAYSWADGIAGLLGLAVPVLLCLDVFTEQGRAVMNDLSWQLPVGLLSGLAIFRLLLAPYWLYKEKEAEVDSLREQLSQAQESSFPSSALIIQHMKHEFYWRNDKGETSPMIPSVPHENHVTLQVMVRITAPSLQVEYVQLAIMQERIRSNWEPLEIDFVQEEYLYFPIPDSVNAGRYQVRLIAGNSSIERFSRPFDIDVPPRRFV